MRGRTYKKNLDINIVCSTRMNCWGRVKVNDCAIFCRQIKKKNDVKRARYTVPYAAESSWTFAQHAVQWFSRLLKGFTLPWRTAVMVVESCLEQSGQIFFKSVFYYLACYLFDWIVRFHVATLTTYMAVWLPSSYIPVDSFQIGRKFLY